MNATLKSSEYLLVHRMKIIDIENDISFPYGIFSMISICCEATRHCLNLFGRHDLVHSTTDTKQQTRMVREREGKKNENNIKEVK